MRNPGHPLSNPYSFWAWPWGLRKKETVVVVDGIKINYSAEKR
jgi:hypothetical protein